MREYTATELANNTGDVLSAAAQDAVEITRHGKPRFIIMSNERFEQLKNRGDTRRAVANQDMTESEAQEMVAALEKSIADE